MYNEYPKGSQWRKWDLHFHTPSSFDYQNGSITNEDIIDGLSANGIDVIAITDHNLIDVERIKELQGIGKTKKITVLPGIELRCELGGSDSIHFIGIFSEECNLEEIWTDLQSNCGLKPSEINEKGHEKIYVELKKTADLIHKLGGIVTIHSGSKSNTIENITNSLPHKMALKKDISSYIDIFEMGKEKDCGDYIKHVFPFIERNVPMIICSDNHDISDYKLKQNLWIKADPNFKGLKQVLSEPSDRISLSEDIPNEKYKSNIIDKVRFIDASGENVFLKNWIDLNPNLNTIIGGKSTGKSLLLYFIAKSIDNNLKSSVTYDFKDLDFEVQWGDGKVYQYSSGDFEDHRGLSKKSRPITYISQLYINDLLENDKKEFIELILDFLKENDGFKSYYDSHNENVANLTLEIDKETATLINLKNHVSVLQEELLKLGDKDAKLKDIEEIKNDVKEAKLKSKFSEQDDLLLTELQARKDSLLEKGKKINSIIQALEELKQSILSNYDDASRNIEEGFQEQQQYLEQEETGYVQDALDKVKELFEKFKSGIGETFADIQKKRLEKNTNSKKLEEVEDQIKTLLEKSKYQEKIEALENDQQKYLAEVNLIQNEEKKLKIENDKLRASLQKILANYENRHKAYLDLVTFINVNYSQLISEDDIRLKVDLDFNSDNFFERFIQLFNLKTTNFSRIYSDSFDNNAFQYDSSTHTDIINKIVEDLLYKTKIFTFKASNNFENSTKALLGDFSRIDFKLYQNKDNIERMSPGKRGLVLLKLYLSLNKAEYPILIDQPEDNLDNRTVYSELKDFLKSKKIQRQIIMVTHNANLVVATDSELIIVANQDGEDGKDNKTFRFEYVQGALEHTFLQRTTETGVLYQLGIREHVCAILEGGKEAFQKREVKYGFKENLQIEWAVVSD